MTTAVNRIGTGPVARRPTPAQGNSLAAVDACSLLKGAPEVILDYYRSTEGVTPPNATSIRIGDRNATIIPRGLDNQPDHCVATLEHRRFLGPTGRHRVELVQLSVSGTAPMTELCDHATSLTRAVAARLPAR